MPKEIETRNYHMSDADLAQKGKGLATSIKRDLADFAVRNVTATTLSDFEIFITEFDDTSTDEELLGEQMEATDAKNKLMEDVKLAIRPIRNMADLVFKGKGKYHSFGFKDMANMNAEDLFRLAKRVVRVGGKFLADLAPQGLTQAQLNDLKNLYTLLDEKIDDAEDKAENRDLETQNRIQKGNDLWEKMVELASIGKSLYIDTNPAKYNDYVLETTPPNTPPVTPPKA